MKNKWLGQLFWVGLKRTLLDEDERAFLQWLQPGGIVLFRRNCTSAEQVMELIRKVKEIFNIPPIIAIDEEGGRVERLHGILPHRPPLAWWRDRPSEHNEMEYLVALCLRSLGITMNLHPVVDIAHPGGWMDTLERCLYRDVRRIAQRATTLVQIYTNMGLMSCLKHFPGLGRGREDTHEGRTIIDVPFQDLEREDLYPFRKVGRLCPAIMMAHAEYTGLQSDMPASLSPPVYELLRHRLRFTGLALTDDLHMNAVGLRWPPSEAARMALQAGADGLLFCHEPLAAELAYEHIRAALSHGNLQKNVDRSLARVLRLKKRYITSQNQRPDPLRFRRSLTHLITLLEDNGWDPWPA